MFLKIKENRITETETFFIYLPILCFTSQYVEVTYHLQSFLTAYFIKSTLLNSYLTNTLIILISYLIFLIYKLIFLILCIDKLIFIEYNANKINNFNL